MAHEHTEGGGAPPSNDCCSSLVTLPTVLPTTIPSLVEFRSQLTQQMQIWRLSTITGLVDWTSGLDWWIGLVDWTGGLILKFMHITLLTNKTHLPVGLHDTSY